MGALMGEKIEAVSIFRSQADEKEFIEWVNKNRRTLSTLKGMKPGQVVFYALLLSWHNDRIQASKEEGAALYTQGRAHAQRLLEMLPEAMRRAEEAGIMAGIHAAIPAIISHAKAKASLEKGRPLGTAKIKRMAAVRDDAIKAFALNYFKRNPGADNGQCANEVRIMLERDQRRYGPLLSHWRIVKKLSGVKKRALA